MDILDALKMQLLNINFEKEVYCCFNVLRFTLQSLFNWI